MKLIMENWRKFLFEARPEEAEMIKDALDIPISEYPFSDIFGDSYRKIMEYRTINPDTPFGNAIDILKKFGWTIETTKETVEKNKRIKRKTGKKKLKLETKSLMKQKPLPLWERMDNLSV